MNGEGMNANKTTTRTTRQDILNAATSVVARNGFEGATLNEIAQEAGVTEPRKTFCFRLQRSK
jgi:AcrR family transcriptional regulator